MFAQMYDFKKSRYFDSSTISLTGRFGRPPALQRWIRPRPLVRGGHSELGDKVRTPPFARGVRLCPEIYTLDQTANGSLLRMKFQISYSTLKSTDSLSAGCRDSQDFAGWISTTILIDCWIEYFKYWEIQTNIILYLL